MSAFIITSWDFSSSTPRKHPSPHTLIEPDNWYHCQRDASGLREWLESADIPSEVVDSLLADDTRPRFERYSDDCFLVILRGINLNEGSDPDDMLSLRILWFKNAVISTRKVPSKGVTQMIRMLESGAGPTNLQDLMTSMANGINGVIEDFLDPVEDFIDALEVGDEQKPINATYSRLLRLRRYLKPQSYVFQDLLDAKIPVLASQRYHFKNCLDTTARINESIEFYLDQIDLYVTNRNQQQAEVMNRNTYLFSVIAGIFLPAGFFTGLLGVNIGGIPGTEDPIAFPLFCVALLLVVAAEVIILKRLRFI